MDSTQAAPFQQQLLAQKAALLAQMAAQRGGVIGRAESAAARFGHPEDSQAQLDTERTLEFAIDDRETLHLAAIEAALARIAAGTFGQCTDCAAAIAPARLQATPEAARCIPCQEKAEAHAAAA